MTKKSITFLSIFFLTAVVIAGGVLWYSNEVKKEIMETSKEQMEINTPQGNQDIDTSDWKTYRNEKYGIQFQYPDDENRWVVREYDYSKDKSLLMYPYKSIAVEYIFPELGITEHSGETITFSITNTPYNSDSTSRRDPNDPNNYTFQFNGQLAVAEKIRENAITGFMERNDCNIGHIIFTLPNLPAIWTSNDTVNVLCGSSKAPKENPRIFRKILDTVEFFKPKA